MIVRITIPGDSVKVRLDNTFRLGPAVFGRPASGHALVAPRSPPFKALTFGGNGSMTVTAGATVESDPIPFHVDASRTSRSVCSWPLPRCSPASTTTQS
jgi:hypothetical protein